jgi:hypothetical protein
MEITDKNGADPGNVQKIYKQALEKGVQINIGGQEFTREDEHLIDSIVNKTDTRCNFHEGAKANYIIEAAYSSMREEGKWKSPRCIQ